MNRDFVEILSALSEERAEFLVVGAHAMAAHGRPRATGDLDIWVRPTAQNAKCVWKALLRFGAPLHDLAERDLATPGNVFQIGVPPCRVDVMTQIDGAEFDQAWKRKTQVSIGKLAVPVLGREDLLANKKATGRPQDLADVAWLEGGKG